MRFVRKVACAGLAVVLATAGSVFTQTSPPSRAARSAFAQAPGRQGPPRRPKAGEEDPDRPKGQTAISVSVDLVSLQALVTDQKGNVVTGLRPENFTVYEDNVKQEISHFAPVEANITVVMLVEYSKQVSWFIYEVWNAIYGFANTLRPGDWVAVIGYDLRPTILQDFTQDRSKLMDALRRFVNPASSIHDTSRLRSFAEFTGGEAYFPRFVTEFPSIFNNVSAQLRNQYSIGYVSTNPKHDGKFRKIRVDVTADINNDGKPDKLKVLTRKGYVPKPT